MMSKLWIPAIVLFIVVVVLATYEWHRASRRRS